MIEILKIHLETFIKGKNKNSQITFVVKFPISLSFLSKDLIQQIGLQRWKSGQTHHI